ncbi:MAG: cysteine desulfurase NifS [Candidatus Firestonebacteria bacterium RIFOXYC2_FULL_39_67]|nr:MAG: cysteine desulfurase NifS [Candidatus Firestonebacteria bacterium RIFOXYD2_FULL_39_29]OGF54388.1 MAG: cysteine desulfurase NifS [Candidatus Firestonebacteria bacterium RifOxyC12_full_39_7]OGF54681.1 MAG: cysteine desulfurase NifS [Candidatus Firestonebacteria bacterium RIFOXYC2_FULL_39_67]
MEKIYLDYNATTPIHPLAAKEMEKYIYEYFGNPSSSHWAGKKAHDGVENARKQVASLLGCLPEEIVFTSGGTESNNYAIRGAAELLKHKGNHIITTRIEHPAVLKPCQYLEKKGFEVTYLPVDKYGRVSPDAVRKAVKPSTILITIMHANNEVGTIQPLKEISEIAKKYKILFHTDAAQSVGKIPTKVEELGVDLLTVAGHKLYAPKGIGVLYIREGVGLQPLILGAGHERGRRAGTENVIQIAGLGKACQLMEKEMEKHSKKIKNLRDYFYLGIKKLKVETMFNGDPENGLPNTLNISFKGINSNKLLEKIPSLAVSTGSACHANSSEPSKVLMAMGMKKEEAFGAIRFSLGLFTTKNDIEHALAILNKALKK